MKRLLLTLMGVSAMVTMLVGQDLQVCEPNGYTLTSEANAVGGTVTYTWYENDKLIPGSAATLSIPAGKPAGNYQYVRKATNAECTEVSSNTFTVRVWAEVSPPTITSPADGCAGSSYVFTVPLADGVTYTWTGGGGDNAASGNSYTYANAAAGALTVTVQASENGSSCRWAPATATVTAYARPVITMSADTAIYIGTAATLSVTANPATGYQWRKNGAFTSEGSNYTSTTYITATLTASATYSAVVFNDACSVTSKDVVVSIGISQPQGNCTYTEPAMMWTFVNFPADYNASTYVTLTDGRDNKNYPVVNIGGRWIMARNLNYQGTINTSNTLTWQANSTDPTTSETQPVTDLIGHFWCPGSTSSTVSIRASCDVWGALYSWETAMMVDGKWSNDSRNSSAWGNEPTYGTNTTSGNTNNGGRGGGNHGICPPSWHIPTDAEWGELLNAMESISGTPTHNTGTGERGADAGARGKSTCMCSFGICNTDEIVSWTFDNTTSAWGTDFYGFRALPSGNRGYAGVVFAGRGAGANFWSSSASSNTFAWHRLFHYTRARVTRNYTNSFRSYGMSVRCIRNSD